MERRQRGRHRLLSEVILKVVYHDRVVVRSGSVRRTISPCPDPGRLLMGHAGQVGRRIWVVRFPHAADQFRILRRQIRGVAERGGRNLVCSLLVRQFALYDGNDRPRATLRSLRGTIRFRAEPATTPERSRAVFAGGGSSGGLSRHPRTRASQTPLPRTTHETWLYSTSRSLTKRSQRKQNLAYPEALLETSHVSSLMTPV